MSYISDNLAYFQKSFPVEKVGTREKFKHEENETPSISDPVFANLRVKEELKEQDVFLLSNPMAQVEASQEWIEIHLDRRVAAFFQQLIVCYKTPFAYEQGETVHQAESTATLYQQGQTISFNSAHSSTLPCLNAFDRAEYTRWKQGSAVSLGKPEGFVYLKDADAYRLNNSTMGLIVQVNKVDIDVDGVSTQSKLRTIGIDIINQVALGEISPQDGLRLFVEKFKIVIEHELKEPHNDAKIRVLSIYNKCLTNLEDEMLSESFFDQLVSVYLKNDEQIPSLRKLVYTLRFKIIRECQEIQTVILNKINVLRAELIGIGRKKSNFDIAFKLVLLQMTASRANQVALEKLLCVGQKDLNSLAKKKRGFSTTLKYVVIHKDKISDLVNGQLNNYFYEIRRKELLFRRDLFKGIRHLLGLTQNGVVIKYKTLFPTKPFSQSGVSRVENDIKIIDQGLALDLSKVFSIDPGLFFPALFTSLYS